MARRRQIAPTYVRHKSSGRARAVWTDANGQRHDLLLPGRYNSQESQLAFSRLRLELVSSSRPINSRRVESVSEALLAYLQYATEYYGDKSGELASIKLAIKPIRQLYGNERVQDFGPRMLAAVREHYVLNDGCSRTGANKRVNQVKRAFKWLSSQEMVPVAIYEALRTLAPLKAGRTIARESVPRGPVDDDTVAATLAEMSGHCERMVRLLQLTGARPGELFSLTLSQLDRSKPVWVYRVASHKNAYRGQSRVIMFGPRSQAILTDHLEKRGPIDPGDPVFSPRADEVERHERMRAERKSKVQPSQFSRKKRKPKRKPGDWYEVHALAHAIRRAAKRAGVGPWSAYQLRHSHATKLREQFGLEAAQTALGHSSPDTTLIYAKRSETLAEQIAKQVG